MDFNQSKQRGSGRDGQKEEFLRRYRVSCKALDFLEMELKEAHERALSLKTVILDGMPHGSGHRDISDVLIRLEGQEARYFEAFEESEAIRHEIKTAIQRLENQNECDVLYFMYIAGMRAEQVAECMQLSTKHIYRIRKKAIEHLQI